MGISIALESADGFFVLTQRGAGTPNYPGAVFTLGGGLQPKDSVTAGLLDEIVHETGLTHYDPSNIIITAVGVESQFSGGRHSRVEIVAYLKTDAMWNDIVNSQRKTDYQTDVTGLIPLSSDIPNFASRAAMMGASGELLPAAELGLVYAFLKKREGLVGAGQASTEATALMATLNKYERRTFVPPRLNF